MEFSTNKTFEEGYAKIYDLLRASYICTTPDQVIEILAMFHRNEHVDIL